jgi:hypothetical protein
LSENSKFSDIAVIFFAVASGVGAIVELFKQTNYYLFGALILVCVILVTLIFLPKKNAKYDRFRMIDQKVKLTIEDITGALVRYENTSTYKVLKNDVADQVFWYYCDGKIENIKVDSGTITGVKEESGKIVVQTNLPRVFKRGDLVTRSIKFDYKNSFLERKEYWHFQRIYHGEKINIYIVFPVNRPYKSYQLFESKGAEWIYCEKQPVETITQGRPTLHICISKMKISEVFRIEWEW